MPDFTSERLSFEPACPAHAAGLVCALGDPHVHLWIRDTIPTEFDFERQFSFVSNLPDGRSPDGREVWLTWTLFLRAEPTRPIGYVQATIRQPERVTIAYVLGREYWRRGYASEAVTAMLDWVFGRYEVEVAVAEVDTRNHASMEFAQSLGLSYTKTVREAGSLRGAPYDDHVYCVSRLTWRSIRKSRADPPTS